MLLLLLLRHTAADATAVNAIRRANQLHFRLFALYIDEAKCKRTVKDDVFPLYRIFFH
jgi:hypothetical protein